MTELQYLIDLLLNHKLPPATKKSLAERIGEVEASYNRGFTPSLKPVSQYHVQGISQQAPSTQRILDEMVGLPTQAQVAPPPAMMAQALPPAQRIVGGEVQTGKGSRGPRKF